MRSKQEINKEYTENCLAHGDKSAKLEFLVADSTLKKENFKAEIAAHAKRMQELIHEIPAPDEAAKLEEVKYDILPKE